MRTHLRILLVASLQLKAAACIWDAESLSREKFRSHDLAQTILSTNQFSEDTNKLQNRIKELEANRQENDANWWNNLAGAYLRLNQPERAVKLLEPVVQNFPNDYGIHANLGTAYHLLGRYQEAEKEIARDLEINSDAHFGLEKYHLALLQYLVRDPKYQARHVYVDEFTTAFLEGSGGGYIFFSDRADELSKIAAEGYSNNVSQAEADYEVLKTNNGGYRASEALATVAAVDPAPPYRTNWNLGINTNFEAGVIYMAQMNPKEPACLTMLGIAAWEKHDYNLAIAAFNKAISLGSPQSELLKQHIDGLKNYIEGSLRTKREMTLVAAIPLLLIAILVFLITRGIIKAVVGTKAGSRA